MASEKNITMRQFNGTDYDTLYPKTKAEQVEGIYGKDEILTDTTKTLYGLNLSATPNDVFTKLAMPLNSYGFKLKVQLENGTPVPNVTITGDVLTLTNETPVTDSNGECFVYATTKTPSVNIEEFFCTKALTQTLTFEDGTVFTPAILTIKNNTDLILYRTSQKLRHLNNVKLIDVCVVGGGGGGSLMTQGGGGGFAVNVYNVNVENISEVTFTIGSGGSGAVYGSGNAGHAGGTTSFYVGENLIGRASGGEGQGNNSSNSNGVGGGYDTAGTNGTVHVFEDETLPLPGGGGGGAGNGFNPSGGLDFGGAGLDSQNDPYGSGSDGGVPGGGGGGAYQKRGGAGGAGGVYVRIKEAK